MKPRDLDYSQPQRINLLTVGFIPPVYKGVGRKIFRGGGATEKIPKKRTIMLLPGGATEKIPKKITLLSLFQGGPTEKIPKNSTI